MDDFVNILQRDYGLKPQGKSAPMSVSSAKSTIPQSSSSSLFSSSSSSGKNNRNSMENLSFGPAVGGILEDEDFLFGTSMALKNGVKSASLNLDTFGSASAFDKTTGMSPIYDDVFGVKFSSSQTYQRPKQSASSHHDDDIFEMQSNYHPRPVSSSSKKPTDSSVNVASSLPIFDGPLYDDDGSDIFGGLPGIKSTNVIYDDVFGGGGGVPSSSVNASSSVFDDILGVPMQTNPKDRASNTRSVAEPSAPLVDFDDLLPGFGGSEPAKSRKLYEGEDVPQKSGKDIPKKPENDSFHMAEEDPFIVLQTTVPTTAGTVGDANVWASFHSASEHTRDRTNDGNIGASGNSSQLGNEPQSPYRKKVNESTAKQETEQTNGDSVQRGKFHLSNSLANNDVRSSSSPNNHVENSSSHGKQNKQVLNEVSGDSPQRSKAVGKRNEVWVSVEDVKLVTQPTTAPPPARRPPPLPSSRQSNAAMNRVNGELKEDRDMMERSASASSRATEDATERVRSKLQDRGKEEKVADTRATGMRDMKEKVSDITGNDGRAYRDEDSKANEGEERRAKEIEREEREKESREKWQKEREREKEKEREREREKDRIAVERATQEARERAATEARQRAAVERATAEARERAAAEARERAAAERAAVERANAEARERAAAEAREKAAVERATAEARERAAIEAREKAAVERATAEARERAAAEARERAAAERAAVEKATAEARERAAAEARERAAAERAAAERAAVERATSEARARAERAAVERATKEARDRAAERAASGARERAEKAAVEKNAASREQRKNEDDLEAFFSSSSRAGSAPKQRSPPKTNKPSNEESHKSSNATATVNKVVTPTNFADDWTSLFGAASNAGEFQEVEGETSERRRARLERHQRTAERAAKALDEKNKRDLQTQREQAERHRAGDILDSEIKRWAAGKEGNIRALLSTLQYVLWPECGWQAVSLTDLITGAAVKKVYRKATLCVHPDKVQQKGATIQQKYIAEKVFDLLKEAWNKFNSEELF